MLPPEMSRLWIAGVGMGAVIGLVLGFILGRGRRVRRDAAAMPAPRTPEVPELPREGIRSEADTGAPLLALLAAAGVGWALGRGRATQNEEIPKRLQGVVEQLRRRCALPGTSQGERLCLEALLRLLETIASASASDSKIEVQLVAVLRQFESGKPLEASSSHAAPAPGVDSAHQRGGDAPPVSSVAWAPDPGVSSPTPQQVISGPAADPDVKGVMQGATRLRKESPLFSPEYTALLDHEGAASGKLEPTTNFWGEDRQTIRDREGNKVGTIEESGGILDQIEGNVQVIRDHEGQKVGTIRDGLFGGRVIKDEEGRTAGKIKEDWLGRTKIEWKK
jgi:hypothetical protein